MYLHYDDTAKAPMTKRAVQPPVLCSAPHYRSAGTPGHGPICLEEVHNTIELVVYSYIIIPVFPQCM
jgi:hypothetical protein